MHRRLSPSATRWLLKSWNFLVNTGLEINFVAIPEHTFCRAYVYKWELLYRAICCMQPGHLAMLPPGQRTHADGNMGGAGRLEMRAVA